MGDRQKARFIRLRTTANWCQKGDANSFSTDLEDVLVASSRSSLSFLIVSLTSASSGLSCQMSAQSRDPICGALPAPMASSMNSATLSDFFGTAPCFLR